MPIPDRPMFDSPDPRWRIRITDDGTPTLVWVSGDEAMHSGCGAVAETKHVYLEGSGVARRLTLGKATKVLEGGLGSGLGWLLTADLAISKGTRLRYLGLEHQPPPASVVRQLEYSSYLQNPELFDSYCQWLESWGPPMETSYGDSRERTFRLGKSELCLLCVDAIDWCGRVPGETRHTKIDQFDAIYFDPYSPDTSPALWRTEIFQAMWTVLRGSGRLVSYCVSRAVRDALGEAGFEVSRVTGPPGGKREVLMAIKATPIPSTALDRVVASGDH